MRSLTYTASLFITFLLTVIGRAQGTVDWSSGTFTNCPSEMSPRARGFSVDVVHLNDVLYTYNISSTVTTQRLTSDDFATIASLFTAESGATKPPLVPTGREAPGDLIDILEAAGSALVTDFRQVQPAPDPSGVTTSIKLDATLAAVKALTAKVEYRAFESALTFIKAARGFNPTAGQTAILNQANTLQAAMSEIIAKTGGPHSATININLAGNAKNHVTVHVTELYNGVPTNAKDPAATCDVSTPVLTLSGGLLISTIGGRNYLSVQTPGTLASGSTPQNILAVQDAKNLQPTGVYLLNYDLPWGWSDAYGFTLSAGPTFRLSGPTNTSNFGFFMGGSVHLWKRLFFSFGEQLGEFADFPIGFAPGSVIPANFGALTPINRWTLKPAFGISYQTTRFATSSAAAQNNANAAAPTATPAAAAASATVTTPVTPATPAAVTTPAAAATPATTATPGAATPTPPPQ